MSHEHFGPSTDTRNRNQPDRLQDEAMSARDCRSQRIATSGAPRQGHHVDHEDNSAYRAGNGGFAVQLGGNRGIQFGQQQRCNDGYQYSNQGFNNPYHPNHNRHDNYRPNPSFNGGYGANFNNFNRGYGQRGDVGSQILTTLAFAGINRALGGRGGGIGIGIGGLGGFNNGYNQFNGGYDRGCNNGGQWNNNNGQWNNNNGQWNNNNGQWNNNNGRNNQWNSGYNNGYDRYDRDRYERERYERERGGCNTNNNNNQYDRDQHYQRVIAEQRRVNEQQQRYMQEQQRLYLERERRQQQQVPHFMKDGVCIPTDSNQPYYPPSLTYPPGQNRPPCDGRQAVHDGNNGMPNDGSQQYYYDPARNRTIMIDPRSRHLPPTAVRNGDQYREDNIVPNDGQGYIPTYPQEYTPVPGTFEPQDPQGPVELYDGQPLFENRSGWTYPSADETQQGGRDQVERDPEMPNPHAPNAPLLNALARKVFGITHRDDRGQNTRPIAYPTNQWRR